MREQIIVLPWPPSVNTLWRVFRGRKIVSERGRAWMEEAGKCLIEQRVKPFVGPVTIVNALMAPHKKLWDLDNFNKPILDCLRRNGIIEDDNYRIVRRITAEVGTTEGAVVTIRSAE